MKRAAIERPMVINKWKMHHHLIHSRENDGGVFSNKPECICEQQPNRFRKRDKIAGCGKPRCGLCKSDKLLKIPSHRDLKLKLKFNLEISHD